MKSFESLRVPKYVQLMFHLREQIGQGVLKPGDPLPTREKLMKEHGLSLSTVTRAISELERQGWLVSRQGSGTFVVKRSGEETKGAEETKLVGLLMPMNYYYNEGLVQEIVDEALQKNIHLLVMYSPEDEETELNMARHLFEKEVDAMIWFPVLPKKHVSVASLFGKNKVPVVIGEKVTDHISSPWVCVRNDYYGGTKDAIEYLFNQGHRQIAYVGSKSNEADFGPIPERFNAYRDLMKEKDLWNPETLLIDPALFKEWHVNIPKLEAIFKRPDAPTAIIGFEDVIAQEAIRGLKAIGLRVPEDVAIIGHGDYSYNCYSEPRLSTVSPCLSEYADVLIRALCNQLDPENTQVLTDQDREIMVAQRLLLRDSTKSTDEMIKAS